MNRSFINKKEYKTLFEKYYRSLCHFAYGYINDDEVAEDIVQESYVYLWENEQKFIDELSTKVFLYRMVKNKCLNHLKHAKLKDEKLHLNKEDDFEDSLFEQNYLKEETIRQFYQAINTLPQNYQEIINLALKGLNNEDIATQLNLSVNTIKTHKKGAYKMLRIQLKDIMPSALFMLELLN